MKKLKKVLSLFLLIPCMILFSACGDKKEDNNDSNGIETTTQEQKLTTQEILKFAFDSFDEQSKTQVDGKNSYSAIVGENYVYDSYDNFVYTGMSILKNLSSMETFYENQWCEGKLVTINGWSSYANKISKFYVTNVEENNVSVITIYIMFELSDLPIASNDDSFNLFKFVVDYNHETKSVEVDSMIEKAKNYVLEEQEGSCASYYNFTYKSSGEIVTSTFTRNIDIDDFQNDILINHGTITDYTFFKFNLNTNIASFDIKGFSGAISVETREFLKSEMASYKTTENFVKSAVVTKTSVAGLTESLIRLANATKISDFKY